MNVPLFDHIYPEFPWFYNIGRIQSPYVLFYW